MHDERLIADSEHYTLASIYHLPLHINSRKMLSATENAPKNLEELTQLLEHDAKVKVASTSMVPVAAGGSTQLAYPARIAREAEASADA